MKTIDDVIALIGRSWANTKDEASAAIEILEEVKIRLEDYTSNLENELDREEYESEEEEAQMKEIVRRNCIMLERDSNLADELPWSEEARFDKEAMAS